jgi:hypothetical protein
MTATPAIARLMSISWISSGSVRCGAMLLHATRENLRENLEDLLWYRR